MSYSDDVTWCDNCKCPYEKCERNPKNRRPLLGKAEYSVSHFEGTEYCIKTKQKERNKNDS